MRATALNERPQERLLQFFVRRRSLVVAVCVGSGLAHVVTSTMPFQVGALIDGGGISSSQAGLFALFEVGALALGMILIAPWIDRLPVKALAISSALLAAAANVGLSFASAFPFQLLCGTLAGFGFGCIFAATIASAAASEQPDRLYAIGNGGALLLIMAVTVSLPVAASHFGVIAIFLGIATLAAACCVFFLGFGRGMRAERAHAAAWRIPGARGLLFSWATFSAGTGALYAFSERLGRSIGLDPATIGVVLSAGLLVGLAGTGTAAILGSRINRRRALASGTIGTGLSCLVLGYAPNLPLFAAGVFLYWICYMFLYSYLLGSAAALDASGRVGTLGGGMERLGYGAGAWLGGVLAEHAGYSVTGLLGFAGCMLGLTLGFPSLFRALGERRPEPADLPA
jgi:predicted MFS family arabinose efflux permease